MSISCVDLFCGVGGLTHGLTLEGIQVTAGIDLDAACQFPYEKNNGAKFIHKDISEVEPKEIQEFLGAGEIRVLAGCAPCQPFSSYARRYEFERNGRWALLNEFSRLIKATLPEIVTMENVPSVRKHNIFNEFISQLQSLNYHVTHQIINCCDYGVPQNRKRMVLLASRLGPIKMTTKQSDSTPISVRKAISALEPLKAGESSNTDQLHVSASLSPLNIKRIQASKPGGSWRDWPKELVAKCHQSDSGKTYSSVYGRMEWDKPAPTMTTQCYGYGNGRFGHPEQDRAITLREAAILQSFPKDYKFLPKNGNVSLTTLGRMIGNAVPVGLGRAIGKSITDHINNISPLVGQPTQ